MRKTILVITSSIDCTVDTIMNKYSSIADFFRLNVDHLGDYRISIEKELFVWKITDVKANRTVSKFDICSIYYRKPMFPDLSEYLPSYHSMIQKDITCVINGIADSFDGRILSKPCLLLKSENKVSQLLFAIKHGWKIPVSFIGNNSTSQKRFAQNSIIKPLTTGKVYTDNGCELYQTNYFINKNEDISLTPIYLQNYIQKNFEVRITVINNIFYTVRIDTKDKLDWRKDYENHKYTLIECPKKIKKECLEMLEYYNLKFGAFDYIVTPENYWIFLELNANGQWLWLEEALKLDISKNLMNYLLGN